MASRLTTAAIALAAGLLLPASAAATYRGRNGLIAYDQGLYRSTCRDSARAHAADCFADYRSSGVRVVEPDGSRRRKLRFSGSPVFAPGGRYLATNDGCGIIVGTIGGRGHRITPSGDCGILGTWSPDGRSLVYANEIPYGQIRTIGRNGKGGTVVSVGDHILLGQQPRWSPTGLSIAFVPMDPQLGMLGGIVVARPGSAGIRQLAASGESPTWAPSGRLLAFADHNRVKAVDTTGRIRTLHAGDSPSWSPDGRWIAFVQGRRLEVMRPDGSHAQTIVPRQDGDFTWSPDSRFIAYVGARSARLRVVSLTTRRSHTVASLARSHDNELSGPSWQALPR